MTYRICTKDPLRTLGQSEFMYHNNHRVIIMDHRVIINRKLRFCFKVDIVDSLWQYAGTCTPFKPLRHVCVFFNQYIKTLLLEFLRVTI